MKVEQKYRNAVVEMNKLKQDLASVKETKEFERIQAKKSMERSLATANGLINQLSSNSNYLHNPITFYHPLHLVEKEDIRRNMIYLDDRVTELMQSSMKLKKSYEEMSEKLHLANVANTEMERIQLQLTKKLNMEISTVKVSDTHVPYS
jgi:hypothetical protein